MKHFVVRSVAVICLLLAEACGAPPLTAESDTPESTDANLATCRSGLLTPTQTVRDYAIIGSTIYLTNNVDVPVSYNATQLRMRLYTLDTANVIAEVPIRTGARRDLSPAVSLAVHNGALYWAERFGNPYNDSPNSLWRLTPGETTPTSVLKFSEHTYISNFISNGAALFYNNDNRREIASNPGAGASTAIARSEHGLGIGVRADSDAVYVMEQHYYEANKPMVIRRIPRDGSPERTLAVLYSTERPLEAKSFGINDTEIVWLERSRLIAANKLDGSRKRVIADGLNQSTDLVVDGSKVYFGDYSPYTLDGTLKRADLTSSGFDTLSTTCQGGARQLKVDGCSLYYTCTWTEPRLYARAIQR